MEEIWSEVYGQQSVKSILSKIISSGKIPHSFLFSGNEGVGKEVCALAFAKALYKSINPIGYPDISKSLQTFSEPYIKYIIPLPRGKSETDTDLPFDKLDKDQIEQFNEQLKYKILNPYFKINLDKANTIKISSIRDIKNFLSLKYSEVPYRIIIISDAHLMNEASQNALLKSLEEPPSGTIFILTTPYKNLLRETIRSRCRIIDFQPLLDDELKKVLINNFAVEQSKVDKLIPFSQGSIQNALDLSNYDIDEIIEKLLKILRNCYSGSFNAAYKDFSRLLEDDELDKSLKFGVSLILYWFVDIERYRTGNELIYFKNYQDTLKKYSKNIKKDIFPFISEVELLNSLTKNNVNIIAIINSILLKLHYLTK